MEIYEADIRSYDYETAVGGLKATEYPKKFSLSKKVSVKNQVVDGKEILACGACAITTVMEYIFGEEFSEGYAYSKLRNDNHNTPGLYLTVALDILRKIGVVPKSYFDMLAEMPIIKDIVNKFPELAEISKKYRPGGYANLNYAFKEKKDLAIKDALSKPEEVALVASSNSYFSGPHAFVIDGWDDEKDVYLYQNSYGKEFGINGKGEIPKSEVDAVFAIFAEDFVLPFKDVTEDRYDFKAIKNMYMSGIVNGVSPDSFEPDRPLTRGEMCIMLDRNAEKEDETNRRIFKLIYELFNKLNNSKNKKG